MGQVMGRLRSVARDRMAGFSKADLDDLRRRVDELETALAESRALNERVADVVDIVAELLVPLVDRDEERLRELLARVDATAPGAQPRR